MLSFRISQYTYVDSLVRYCNALNHNGKFRICTCDGLDALRHLDGTEAEDQLARLAAGEHLLRVPD